MDRGTGRHRDAVAAARRRRLAEIDNVGLAASQFSRFQFASSSENLIGSITESGDTPTAYPAAIQQAATYNNLNQLTNFLGQSLTYDLDGNLLADGQRNYTWDAENRLIGITYPAQPGKQTTFAYDGLSRRTTIASTPTGGGTPASISYIWCGPRLCQARVGGNSPTRAYYAEGELVLGSPAQTYYYAPDQIGSVRRVFASAASAPAYGYDPYGNSLQSTTLLTDFGYAGMFHNADSGLYLTQFRVYDPSIGRWLTREPIGETGDPLANLYGYAAENPINEADPTGLCPGFCQLPNGQIVSYYDMGNGYALIGGGQSQALPAPGAGAAVGNAVNSMAMPTVDKPGGIAGGGASGPVTSPASGLLRDLFPGQFQPFKSVTGTPSVGGALGRMLPGLGTGMMLLDSAAMFNSMQNAPVCTPIL
jgi:RHS repeat-associated protein